MGDKPSVIERLLIQRHTVILLHGGGDAADQLGDAHHVGHFAVDLRIDDVQGNEARLVLRQAVAQPLLDDIERPIPHCKFAGIKIRNLPQQLIGIIHTGAQPFNRKADMVGQRDVNIFAQPPTDGFFCCFYDFRTDVKKFSGHVAQQLHQARRFFRITQVIDFLDFLCRHQIAGLLFEADPKAAQDDLMSIRVRNTDKVIADDAADTVSVLSLHPCRGHRISCRRTSIRAAASSSSGPSAVTVIVLPCRTPRPIRLIRRVASVCLPLCSIVILLWNSFAALTSCPAGRAWMPMGSVIS